MKKYYRPGPGWTHLGWSVWEYKGVLRIHVMGSVRLPNGDFIQADSNARRFIRINGGSRKRGLMAWAVSMLEK